MALSEMLTTELAAGDKLRTVPVENVARAKADLALPDAESLSADTLAKVHNILGANLIVLGSYLDLDGQIRVDVRVQNATAREIVGRFSQVGTETQFFDLVRQLGETLEEMNAGREKLLRNRPRAYERRNRKTPKPPNSMPRVSPSFRSFDATRASDLLLRASHSKRF